MANLETARQQMRDRVPFYRVLGIELAAVAPESVEVTLAQTPERLNHVGTMHAAAQFGLGEAAGGAMAATALEDLIAEGATPVVTQLTNSYQRSARGDLRAVATLSADEQARIRGEMATQRRATFAIPVQVFDAAGKLTTELQTVWVLLGPRA